MTYLFRIQRYNPEQDRKPRYETFEVELEDTDRVLDGLIQIKSYQDGSLTFRRSCAHGVCGSDAMRVNGRNALACKQLMRDLGKKVTVEPMLGYPIVKDLVVDQDAFFEQYRSVLPHLVNDERPAQNQERIQSIEERERYDDTTKCILCAACTTSCPSFWANEDFVGPAAIVNAHRFIFDSRDQGNDERLSILNSRNGVWRCRTIYNCTVSCPRGIEVTKAIGEVKQAILYRETTE